MAKVTLNKDGTPRKKGSGRRKGSISLTEVTLEELPTYGLEPTDKVVVGRKFIDNLRQSYNKSIDLHKKIEDNAASAADKVAEKIAFIPQKLCNWLLSFLHLYV